MAVQQGMNQQTPAAQHIIRKAFGGMGAGRKRRSRSGGATKRRTTRKRVSRGSSRRKGVKKNRLVAGSAAAKAWGRKMKRLRKRR